MKQPLKPRKLLFQRRARTRWCYWGGRSARSELRLSACVRRRNDIGKGVVSFSAFDPSEAEPATVTAISLHLDPISADDAALDPGQPLAEAPDVHRAAVAGPP